MVGHYGKGLRGLGDSQSGQSWIDIPESTVIVGRSLYLLSEPKLQRGSLVTVKQLRLRPFDLGQQDGCWLEKASLYFSEEEAPLSPSAECLILDERYGVASTSLKVVASERYILILHFSVLKQTLNEFREVNIVHANLYDTLDDTWKQFPLPEVFSRSFTGVIHFRRFIISFFCTASAESVYIESEDNLFLHSLKGGELDRPWQILTLMRTYAGRRPFMLFIDPAAESGKDELSVLRVIKEAVDLYAITISTFRLARSEAQAEGDLHNHFLPRSLRLSLVKEVGWKESPNNSMPAVRNLQLVDGEPLILDTWEGTWFGTAKRVQYHHSCTEGRETCIGVLCWSRFLPSI